MRRETGENTNQRRVIRMEMEFHTLHSILYYLYTNQIVFHSKPGKETGSGLRTIDVHILYEMADQLLLFDLREKAENFLLYSRDIHNITARLFGHYASTHDDLYNFYRNFFCTRLPAIVQTKEFDDFFHQIEGTELYERRNTEFRDLVQTAFSRTNIVSLPKKPAAPYPETGTAEVEEEEEEEEDDETDSADSNYVPSEDEEDQDDGSGMEIDDEEDVDHSGDSIHTTDEESSDGEE